MFPKQHNSGALPVCLIQKNWQFPTGHQLVCAIWRRCFSGRGKQIAFHNRRKGKGPEYSVLSRPEPNLSIPTLTATIRKISTVWNTLELGAYLTIVLCVWTLSVFHPSHSSSLEPNLKNQPEGGRPASKKMSEEHFLGRRSQVRALYTLMKPLVCILVVSMLVAFVDLFAWSKWRFQGQACCKHALTYF